MWQRIIMTSPSRCLAFASKEPKYALLKQIADFFKLSVQDLMEKDLTKTSLNEAESPTNAG
ncbi:hypothetical protein MJL27_26850, partial [Salmonella enterica subsp. enterica serovar Anatum]|nr:hypothetical protein [Salmonella enterica subsp. enterica serovar Anatum]